MRDIIGRSRSLSSISAISIRPDYIIKRLTRYTAEVFSLSQPDLSEPTIKRKNQISSVPLCSVLVRLYSVVRLVIKEPLMTVKERAPIARALCMNFASFA